MGINPRDTQPQGCAVSWWTWRGRTTRPPPPPPSSSCGGSTTSLMSPWPVRMASRCRLTGPYSLLVYSNFFKKILTKYNNSNPVLVLKGVKHEDLMLILEYMYLGECQVGVEYMATLLEVGKELQVKGLYEEEHNNDKLETKETEYPAEGNVDMPLVDSEMINESKCEIESEDILKFKCDRCLKTFDKQYKHNAHKAKDKCKPRKQENTEKKKSAIGPSLLSCELCPFIAQRSQKQSLQDHIQVIHKGEWFSCDQCDFKTKERYTIKPHKQTKHEGLKFECGICGASYSRKGKLQDHIETNHNKVRYACTQCDYQTTQKHSLVVHMQSEHEGRLLSCSECDYQSLHSSSLNSHQKNNHGGIVYKCESCETRFKDRFTLNDHKKYNLCILK